MRRARHVLAVALLAAAAWAAGPVQPAAAVAGPVAAAPPVQCVGTGTDGNRLQLVYAYEAGTTNRLTEREPVIRLAAWAAQQNVNDSARMEGAQRWLKFVTTSTGCQVIIQTVQLPAGSTFSGDYGAWLTTLKNAGLTANNRNYLVYAENLAGCVQFTDSGGYVDNLDPGTSNTHNSHPYWTTFAPQCFGGHTITHEFAHSIGGMANGMPNSDGGAHCTDGYETLCGDDGNVVKCADPMAERLLDCGRDDYFGITPKGTWLPSHWNAAYHSLYLAAGSSTTTPATIPVLQPGLLRATDVEGTSIAFSWTSNVNPIGPGWTLTYEILRNGSVVATAPGWRTTARVTGLTAGTTASYAVRSRLVYAGVTRLSANSVAVSVTTTSGTAPAGAIEGGSTVAFTNDLVHSGGQNLTLDLLAYSTADNATITQWWYNSAPNQRWTVASATGGTYTVASEYSGKCLTPLNGTATAGTRVVQATCNGSAAQRWTFTSLGGVTYQIANGGLCIAAENNGSSYDTPLVVASCSTSQPSQRWTVNRFK